MSKVALADYFQGRSVSPDRFVKNIGNISNKLKEDIRSRLSPVLSIENEFSTLRNYSL